MILKSGNRFSNRIMRKGDEVLIRFNRIRTDELESVAGISRPRRGAFRGAGPKLAPSAYLPVEYAPLRRKGLRAVRSPSFTARFFHAIERTAGRLACAGRPRHGERKPIP